MFSWSQVVTFSQTPTRDEVKPSDNDREVTFRVMNNLPVIIWDNEARERRVVPVRWGFPHSKNWKVPRPIHVRAGPIHARAETIETTKAFAAAFLDGQRGIVIVKTFNEAPDVSGPTVQHTITPGDRGAIGIAFVWRQFDLADLPGTMRACVMVTVPANNLIATLPTDRMPAVLADEDWGTWLGEGGNDPVAAKAACRTVQGVKWTMAKEQRAATAKRKPTMPNPTGLI
jgi:putative SOS response-associated peptidase YedK